jgi:GTPase
MEKKPVGRVRNFLDQISVAIITVTAPIKLGDELLFKKGDTEFKQTVESIQINKESLKSANKGDVIGIFVDQPVARGTDVFKC